MISPHRFRGAVTVVVACAAFACRAPLEAEPWQVSRAGTFGWIARAGIWADYEATSDISFESNFGPVDLPKTSTDLEGKAGFALGAEYFLEDDFSILAGIDYRVFDPDDSEGVQVLGDQVRIFFTDDVETWELFLAVRHLLPWRWMADGRLRSFVEVKLAYVPQTEFDGLLDDDILNQDQEFTFKGDSYWTTGLSAGLVYQLRDDLIAQLSLIYEWSWGETEDDLDLEFLGADVPFDTRIDPEGYIALVGITWYP